MSFRADSALPALLTVFCLALTGCIGEEELKEGSSSPRGVTSVSASEETEELPSEESIAPSSDATTGKAGSLDAGSLEALETQGEGPTNGDGNLDAYPGDTFPQSTVLDQCRQLLPGIESSEGSQTQYDDSVLTSTQQFAFSGSGEWDDNANYRRYLERIDGAPVHETVDVSNRQFVVVVDRDGRGVGNCTVEFSDDEGNEASLLTLPSGRVAFFPRLYGMNGPVSVRARCLSRTGEATLSLETVDEVATIELDAVRSGSSVSSVDVAFVLDVTGSMAAEIEAMKETIDAVATEIVSTGQARVRLALVAYRDYGDNPEFEFVRFTDDLTAFRSSIASLSAAGGGDVPEAVNQAMDWATRLEWDRRASARMAFVIGDAPPHSGELHSAVQSAAVLACGGVKVFTVATTGQDPTGRFIFRQMSQLSSATHLFLLRGGVSAGSECADHQFRTGDLHKLVIDRVRGELASRDSDPLDIPGLGGDRDTEISDALDECAAQASLEAGEDLAPLVK